MNNQDNPNYLLALYDGICDQTKELGIWYGKMPDGDKRVISSSGHHMFVSFIIDFLSSSPGFTAKIHFGKQINDIKNGTSKRYRFIFSELCKCDQWTNWILCLSFLCKT